MPADVLSNSRFPEDACIALIERGPDAMPVPEPSAGSASAGRMHAGLSRALA